MIARFQVKLPFFVWLPTDAQLDPYEFDFRDLHVRLFPPLTDPSAHPPTQQVQINGKPTQPCSLLRIDLVKTGDYDRRRESSFDPPPEVAFQIATTFSPP